MNKKSKTGPYSKNKLLVTSDKRTRAGRMLKAVQAELIEHLGGNPTVPQRLLIQSVAVKVVRVAMLSERMLETGELSEHGDNHFIAWANSIRLDLSLLGIERKVAAMPDLSDYLDLKAKAS